MKTKRFNLAKILTLVMMLVLLPCAALFVACGGPEDGIEIRSSFKTTYYVGDALDVTGGIIDYTDNGKTTQVIITDEMISGFSTATEGTRQLILTYEGHTTLISYKVKKAPAFLAGNSLYRSVEQFDFYLGTGAEPLYYWIYIVTNEDVSKIAMVTLAEKQDVAPSGISSDSYVSTTNKQLNSANEKYSCVLSVYNHPSGGTQTMSLREVSENGGIFSMVAVANGIEYKGEVEIVKVS